MPPLDDGEQRLLRLLALKRHEVPPPGFFDRLPDRILVSIRAGTEISDGPWWNRLWLALVREPMVGVSYAALGVGAAIFGVSLLQTAMDAEQPPASPLVGMVPGGADFILPAAASHQPGVLYHVPASTPAPWGTPDAYPAAFRSLEEAPPGQISPVVLPFSR